MCVLPEQFHDQVYGPADLALLCTKRASTGPLSEIGFTE